jgi:hypothetical protein
VLSYVCDVPYFTALLQVGNDKPVVISKFILNAKEIEFDGVRALQLHNTLNHQLHTCNYACFALQLVHRASCLLCRMHLAH